MQYMNAYLIFNGNCREAMEFYNKCLGGVLYLSTYGEMPGAAEGFPEEAKKLIIHARITGKGMLLMASDSRLDMPVTQGDNFFVSIGTESIEETERLFKALEVGGKVTMPPQETPWAMRFGMLTDKFGINWMFNFEKK